MVTVLQAQGGIERLRELSNCAVPVIVEAAIACLHNMFESGSAVDKVMGRPAANLLQLYAACSPFQAAPRLPRSPAIPALHPAPSLLLFTPADSCV